MYPITMSLTIHNSEQMNAAMSALAATGAMQFKAEHAIKVDDPDTKKQEAKKPDPKPEAQAAASSAPPAATASSTTKEPTAAADGAKTYVTADAQRLTTELVKRIGADKTRAMLAKYDAPVASKLKADDVAKYCADAEAVLAS